MEWNLSTDVVVIGAGAAGLAAAVSARDHGAPQRRQPRRHHQPLGGQLQPHLSRPLDHRQILVDQRQDRDAREINLLRPCEVEQQIERRLDWITDRPTLDRRLHDVKAQAEAGDDRLTLVVSPLVSLMDDQVASLRAMGVAVDRPAAGRVVVTGAGCSVVPPVGVSQTEVSLAPSSRERIVRETLFTRKRSGDAVPETTVSPRPQLALKAATSWSLSIGSTENPTPATSLATCFCTTTAMRGRRVSNPCSRL